MARTIQPMSRGEAYTLMPPAAAAPVDTVFLGQWSFGMLPNCTDDGWVPYDDSASPFDAWHVDDFAGLGGGSFGLLVPLQGNQSMWVGARPTGAENQLFCGYAVLPGYGNNWDQRFCTKECLDVGSDVTLIFRATWNSEPGYDGTDIDVDNCDDNWSRIPPFPASHMFEFQRADSLVEISIPDSLHSGSLRIRFAFSSDGAFSDQDGLWDTDGGFIMDSLVVVDNNGVVLAPELFEDESVGSHESNDWTSCSFPSGFSLGNTAGNYADRFADLFPALTMVQDDPCVTVTGCVWAFIAGSTDNYACGGHPEQIVVPKGPNGDGDYLRESIWSPVVPLPSSSTEFEMAIHMYPDLPTDNLVTFNVWVRSLFDGCPYSWRQVGPYGGDFIESRLWEWDVRSLGSNIETGATAIQLRIGIADMCGVWCGYLGSGNCHSHGPLIDQVDVYALEQTGPMIRSAPSGLLSDAFPEDGTLTGTVRISSTLETYTPFHHVTDGDSAVFFAFDGVNDLSFGAIGGANEPSVYAYVGVWPQGKYAGPQIEDASRWPLVDSTTSPMGDRWYIIQCDTSFVRSNRRVPDQYCFDLNDDLFVSGDTICYFIAAQSADVGGSWSYYFNRTVSTDVSQEFVPQYPGITGDINEAYANAMEVTCLPTQHLRPEPTGLNILYVDAADGRGIQPFLDTSFDALGIFSDVDRFDVKESGTSAHGLFGYRVKNAFTQLIPVYDAIIWSSGSLSLFTISDELASDDFAVLRAFLDYHPAAPGLYMTGDGIASEWNSLSGTEAQALRNTYMNFALVDASHRAVGAPSNPLVVGLPGSCFEDAGGPDTLIAFGGCPVQRDFDVLAATGNSMVQMRYSDNPAWAAVLSQSSQNVVGRPVQVVLEGFSFHLISSDRPGVPDRYEHLQHVLDCMGVFGTSPTAATPVAARTTLAQNYPNPFNPTTTIEYTLRAAAHVRLRVYNVAGQLVRTLVDGPREPGRVHAAAWDGRNDAGQHVSSGVYFYRLTAGDFVQTRKMVLLK